MLLPLAARTDAAAHNRMQREYFEATDKKTMRPSSSPYLLRQIRRMEDYAELDANHSILEVGAGLGRYSLPMLELGYRLTCLDLSAAMLEKLRTSAGPRRPPVLAGDAAEVHQLTRERFDRAIGFFILHHVHDLERVFRGLAQVLAARAVIAFCEPVAHNPLYYVQIAVTPHIRWKAERGILNMRRSVVFAAMHRAGFEETSSTTFGFFPPFLTNTGAGARIEDALMRLRVLSPFHAFRIFRARLSG